MPDSGKYGRSVLGQGICLRFWVGPENIWTASLDSKEALAKLDEARVPSGAIFSVADMTANPHFIARNLLEGVDVHSKPLKIPAMVPNLSGTACRTGYHGTSSPL